MKFVHPDGSITADFPASSTEYYRAKGFRPLSEVHDVACPANAADDSVRCMGTTAAGTRCQRKAQDGSVYCAAHQPKDASVAVEEAPAPEEVAEAPADEATEENPVTAEADGDESEEE